MAFRVISWKWFNQLKKYMQQTSTDLTMVTLMIQLFPDSNILFLQVAMAV